MTCFDCLRSKECTKQENIMFTVDGIGEYVYQRNVEKKCPNFLDGDAALDLINRLQADKEALINGQETLQKYIAEQKAENERLNDVVKRLQHHSRNLCILEQQQVNHIKSEARKEFAERLHKELDFCAYDADEMRGVIDNLLAEMEGKENGNAQG